MKQAMLIASVMEFAGAVLVGSRVADTIRSKIISVKAFEKEPAVLMLGMKSPFILLSPLTSLRHDVCAYRIFALAHCRDKDRASCVHNVSFSSRRSMWKRESFDLFLVTASSVE
jgi:Phosphate transporter family